METKHEKLIRAVQEYIKWYNRYEQSKSFSSGKETRTHLQIIREIAGELRKDISAEMNQKRAEINLARVSKE